MHVRRIQVDTSIEGVEGDANVHATQVDRSSLAIDAQLPCVGAAGVHLDLASRRRNEHVVADRLDAAVVRELVASVIALAALGEHLDDHPRIQQGRAFGVLETRLADDERICVHVETEGHGRDPSSSSEADAGKEA